jgi:plastocyanin
MRGSLLVMCLAGVVGGLIATLPFSATATSTLPSSGSFTVSDDAFTAAGGGTTVTVAPGGTVRFSYPTGMSMHNVDFGSGRRKHSTDDDDADGHADAVDEHPTGECALTDRR